MCVCVAVRVFNGERRSWQYYLLLCYKVALNPEWTYHMVCHMSHFLRCSRMPRVKKISSYWFKWQMSKYLLWSCANYKSDTFRDSCKLRTGHGENLSMDIQGVKWRKCGFIYLIAIVIEPKRGNFTFTPLSMSVVNARVSFEVCFRLFILHKLHIFMMYTPCLLCTCKIRKETWLM